MEQIAEIHPAQRDVGPVELNAVQLALVAGGLPRGGWSGLEASMLETSESALPRGGWEL